jgi:hypothetical protein
VSEQRWHGFLATDGGNDGWCCTAAQPLSFEIGSLSAAARLAETVAMGLKAHCWSENSIRFSAKSQLDGPAFLLLGAFNATVWFASAACC